VRKAADTVQTVQVIAATSTSPSCRLDERRPEGPPLERYLPRLAERRAAVVVRPRPTLPRSRVVPAEVRGVAAGAPVLAVSAVTGEGCGLAAH